MNDDEQVDRTDLSNHVRSTQPKSYNFLLRLSTKLGTVATKSFVEVRQFLNQEIPLPPAERFMVGMPHLKRKDSQPNPDSQSDNKKGDQTVPELDPAAKLKKIVKQSHEVLASANTVFPVSLFPDTVVVDRTKVTITRRNFFWSSDTMSIRIEDVLNVSASVGPLFGSLTVASRVMSTIDHFQINFFWRNDAIHLKHIIQGYVIAQHNNLDTAHLSKDELVNTLKELGQDSNV